MRTPTHRSRPLGPDLALVAGAIQALLVLALFFLPLSETCVGLRSLEAEKLGCTYQSFVQVYGFTLNGPVLGLAVLLAAAVALLAVARIQNSGLQALWPWLAVALNVVGLLLAWRVVVWFFPTTLCALAAAVMMWRALGPEGRAGWARRRRSPRRRSYAPHRRTVRTRRP